MSMTDLYSPGRAKKSPGRIFWKAEATAGCTDHARHEEERTGGKDTHTEYAVFYVGIF